MCVSSSLCATQGAHTGKATLPIATAELRQSEAEPCVGAIPTLRFATFDRAIELLEQCETCNMLAGVAFEAGDTAKHLQWTQAAAIALATSQALLNAPALPGAGLSDAEREEHIKDCGVLMLRAMHRYEQTSDFGDRGEADKWMRAMHQAIASRPAEYVAKLERERGLS